MPASVLCNERVQRRPVLVLSSNREISRHSRLWLTSPLSRAPLTPQVAKKAAPKKKAPKKVAPKKAPKKGTRTLDNARFTFHTT